MRSNLLTHRLFKKVNLQIKILPEFPLFLRELVPDYTLSKDFLILKDRRVEKEDKDIYRGGTNKEETRDLWLLSLTHILYTIIV